MNNDIKRFLSLRDSLIEEKARLEKRLHEIASALGEITPRSQHLPATNTPEQRGVRRRGGGLSLRDAVLQVTSRGPLTKEEILNAVKQLGYRFSTNNPLNSLGVILYGKNPKFSNQSGRFSPTGSMPAAGGQSSSGTVSGTRKKRKLSAEARERIAAAQRARWAKAKRTK